MELPIIEHSKFTILFQPLRKKMSVHNTEKCHFTTLYLAYRKLLQKCNYQNSIHFVKKITIIIYAFKCSIPTVSKEFNIGHIIFKILGGEIIDEQVGTVLLFVVVKHTIVMDVLHLKSIIKQCIRKNDSNVCHLCISTCINYRI